VDFILFLFLLKNVQKKFLVVSDFNEINTHAFNQKSGMVTFQW
jgi:hypothetical protein